VSSTIVEDIEAAIIVLADDMIGAGPDLLSGRIWLMDGIPAGRPAACHLKGRATEKLGQAGGEVQEYCAIVCAILIARSWWRNKSTVPERGYRSFPHKTEKGDSTMTDKQSNQYEVLSPWAEADPTPFRGISPRLDTLAGKKIGLLVNTKRAAVPTMQVLKRRLTEKFSNVEFTEFANLKPNETITEHEAKEEFENWVKGVDAVITAFGD
jgi:hypothetical protein